MSDLYFEDFKVGDRFTTVGKTVTEPEIIDFAFSWDPQPLHMDADAARRGIYGEVVASGFHTLSLSFSLFFRMRLFAGDDIVSPGLDQVRWSAPVRPGDTLRVEVTVTGLRPSRSKPERGIVTMDHITYNQRDEEVMSAKCAHMIYLRESLRAQA